MFNELYQLTEYYYWFINQAYIRYNQPSNVEFAPRKCKYGGRIFTLSAYRFLSFATASINLICLTFYEKFIITAIISIT